MRIDRGPAEVLEQVVMEVDAIQRRAARVGLVEIVQVVVDKVRKWFSGVHVPSVNLIQSNRRFSRRWVNYQSYNKIGA
jgi:hypothetical protein